MKYNPLHGDRILDQLIGMMKEHAQEHTDFLKETGLKGMRRTVYDFTAVNYEGMYQQAVTRQHDLLTAALDQKIKVCKKLLSDCKTSIKSIYAATGGQPLPMHAAGKSEQLHAVEKALETSLSSVLGALNDYNKAVGGEVVNMMQRVSNKTKSICDHVSSKPWFIRAQRN